MQVATATRISLETGCCAGFSVPLLEQLGSGAYDECSVLSVPDSIQAWRDEHRTARKRADRAFRVGYQAKEISRAHHADDIYAVNTSMPTRQGRPMSDGYLRRPVYGDDTFYCPRHEVRTWGVLGDDTLVAYLWMYRCGELALVSSILGHADHLDDGVMFLLFERALRREIADGGFVVYNRHDSGTDGLRWFKERLGFQPAAMEWAP